MEEMEPIEEESEPELVEKPKEKPKVDVDIGEEYCIKGDRAYYGSQCVQHKLSHFIVFQTTHEVYTLPMSGSYHHQCDNSYF